MNSPSPARLTRPNQGFTLIEVLMAVGVVAILMAIVIPVIGGAQNSAKRAKTRAQFAQWSTAIEVFRQEYGYYPAFHAAGLGASNDGLIDTPEETRRFVETLSGRHLDGTALESGDPGLLAGNTKRIAFCAFGTDDLTTGATPHLQDAFGNTSIVVMTDRNLSGAIETTSTQDFPVSLPPSTVQSASSASVPVTFPTNNLIRAGVAFYSAGDGHTPVTSW